MSVKVYYFVCNMVLAVLSSFYYIFDGELDENALRRMESWSIEDAAGWFANKAITKWKTGSIDEDLRRLVKVSEAEGDKVVFYAAERINQATDSLKIADLLRDEIALFHYMHWLQTTLADGSQVIDDPSTQLDKLFASEIVLRLRLAVEAEIRKIENLDLPELVESANRVSKDIFNYWQAHVIEMCDANSG